MIRDVIDSLYKIFSEDAYLNLIVSSYLSLHSNDYTPHEKRLYTRITYGVVENKLLIDFLLNPLIRGKRVKPNIKNALRIGVYCISFMDIPNHYIVNELVETIKKVDYKASTFVNAILRSYIKTNAFDQGMESLNKLPKLEKLSIQYSLNVELVTFLSKQYKDDIETILKHNDEIKNYYRINTLKTNKEEVVDKLSNLEYTIDGVKLITNDSLINHQLFKTGKIIAQDLSSMEVAIICNPKPNIKVLDACSAPGAKSMHLAAIMNNTGSILACDIYEHKLMLINENKEKLGVTNVKTLLMKADEDDYQDLFDLVLVDAPCSGLGVINHKGDLKYKMNLAKITEINILQKRILENTCKYVKLGGNLVYSTCTINKYENEYLIKDFLNKHPEFIKEEEKIMVQNINTDGDGFYICKMRKATI